LAKLARSAAKGFLQAFGSFFLQAFCSKQKSESLRRAKGKFDQASPSADFLLGRESHRLLPS